jgi:probable 2-oxoglutarate dehydrogenase E1 component DHKTD1
MVWPASAEADFNPETGVWKEWLVKIGRASVDVPEVFVSISTCVCFVDVG